MVRRTRGDANSRKKKDVSEQIIGKRQRKRIDPNTTELQETIKGENDNSINKVNMGKNNPMQKIRIANQHTASIIFPQSIPRRRGEIHDHPLPHINLPAGSVTEIDVEIWEKLKDKTQMISHYIDAGLLTEVGPGKERVEASISRTSFPEPPEHLLSDDEDSTRIERETTGQVLI